VAAAIVVEGLGKKFALRHLGRGSGYSTFRDALADGMKRMGRKLTGRAVPADGDSSEEFWALRDLGFTVGVGEKVGIIGRNGAGKSTLLKVLSRIIEPTRGRIRIQGRVASLLEVGTGFHPELTGRENIFFNGSILGMSKAEITRQFDAIVEFAEVEKFLDTPVKHYSSGMYVRLGFAVAAHLEPEILVVDEVLAVGDARFQKKCLGKLQDIGRAGRTVLFVSHNMSSILQFTDRVIVMNGGQIIQDGDNESGVREYLRINEEASQAINLAPQVPWFRVDGFTFDQGRMEVGFNVPLRFLLEVSLERDLEEVEIVLPILNSIGARIVSARTVLPRLARGRQKIVLTVPDHRLIPGTYMITLVMREKSQPVFVKEQLITIELVADQIEEPFLMPFLTHGKDRFGCFCPIEASPCED
jgi:lipopolysaccharide transport system ATP-binding protein